MWYLSRSKAPDTEPDANASPCPNLATSVTAEDRLLDLQRNIGNQSVQRMIAAPDSNDAQSSPLGAVRSSGGERLPQETEKFMQARFGTNLSDVRVHADEEAAKSAVALGANAYATGRDIYFAPGKYAPSTPQGEHLLAHELAHTVQQRDSAGGVESMAPLMEEAAGFDATLEAEAEDLAAQVTRRSALVKAPSRVSGPIVKPIIQRQPRSETGEPAKPISSELQQVIDSIHQKPQPDLNAAFVILRGRSMTEMLNWLTQIGWADLTLLYNSATLARQVGGERLVIAMDAVRFTQITQVSLPYLSGVANSLRKLGDSAQEKEIAQFLQYHGLSERIIGLLSVPQAVWDARGKYYANAGAIGVDNLEILDEALTKVAYDNSDLMIAFYNYYSRHKFKIMTPDEQKKNKGRLAETEGYDSDTLLQPDFIRREPTSLGALLIHEFTHTHHEGRADTPADYQEGEAYGIEDFLIRHASGTRPGDSAPLRSEQIQEIMTRGGGTFQTSAPASRWEYLTSSIVMQLLYEVAETGKTSYQASPLGTPKALDRQQARALAAEYVMKAASDRSDLLKKIVDWVKADFERIRTREGKDLSKSIFKDMLPAYFWPVSL